MVDMASWKEIFFGSKGEKKKKEKNKDIPEDILKNLPKGTKIKKVVITPQSIFRGIFYLILIFWLVSIVRGFIGEEEYSRTTM